MFGRKFPWEDDEELDSNEFEDGDTEDDTDDDTDDDDDYSYVDDDDDDDDDNSYMDDDDDDDDDEALFVRIERAFREERANVRSCDDVHELRHKRAGFLDMAEGNGREAGRIRARDLIELVDERITDLKARRLARRYR